MSSSFFNPSFAFSSHLDPGGTPLSELSWSSSLAVVAVSFSGLFAVIALMLACLCCKKGGVGFKEFENTDGEEYAADLSAQGSPAAAAQNGPDVYVLPLTEVSLPMAKQPGRSAQLLRPAGLGRHGLLYLEEIGHGWFGKVFLGEANWGLSSAQVVVKELKVSASVHEQTQFLEEAQPYRALQHSNLLRCLAQCAEVTPYLLVMEFCPVGYLRSCRAAESLAPDPRTLQRMACEVACGVLHLHRHNFVHSDLALRNCLLTADLTVKIGDYGLSHGKYREDYFVTADQLWVPLRWIAPELVDEVHCNLLVVDQTKASNVWSLGVTIWELFELGAQPYPHHSDRQVLAYAVREQQLKLPKPQLPLMLSDRWYEVMQFCWLQPEQRPTAAEVHLLLSYLCAKDATVAEDEFEQRWRSLRPGGGGAGPGSGAALGGAGELAAASSFPLLEQFAGDSFHADGDDVLTVTETSRGLNFEYKWEAGHCGDAFPPPGDMPSPGCAVRLQELCAPDSAPPGVVPVLSAHSPSVGSEYFIRLEEPAPAAGHDPDCAGCAPNPCAVAPSSEGKDHDKDLDGSAATSLAMEPLLGQAPPVDGPRGHCDHYPSRCSAQDLPRPSHAPSPKGLMPVEPGDEAGGWGVATICPPLSEDPLGTHVSGTAGAPRSAGREELGEAQASRATQLGHWGSNVSANNNSGGRTPEAWGAGCTGGGTDCCSGRKQPLRAVPEQGHPLALEDPREPPLGSEGASFGQELGRCLDLPHLHPAEGPPPSSSLFTPPWRDAAGSEGNTPETERRLVEGSSGPQRLLASIPSPSREGALLPTQETGTSTALLASPMPASSQAAAMEPAQTQDSGSSSPEVPGSEDEDTIEATSGVFTDVSSDSPQVERRSVTPAFRCLQKQVGTPDSLDSLDIPSLASDGGCEVFSPSTIGPSGGQPRALDSGYDTENYESPEFVLKEAHESCEPEVLGGLASEGESPGAETQLSASLSGLSEKNPYRDSAYFSDLDTEPEPLLGPEKRGGAVGPGPDLESPQSPGPQPAQPLSESEAPGEAQSPEPREVSPSPPPEDSRPGPTTCPTDLRREPPWAQSPAQGSPMPSPGRPKVFLLTPVPRSSDSQGAELQEPQGLQSALQERTGAPGAPRTPLCLALPGLPAAPEGRPEEEEEDSEDSEESDEELRCYSIQEPSEDSDEEAPVPVVVAESQSARHLRSLLKMPSLLSEAFCEDLERKKKAVSFFDDVTVYLFDQESPTRELGEPFPGAQKSPPAFLAGSPGSPGAPCRPRRDESSPHGFTVQEGSRFQWDHGVPQASPVPEPALAPPAAPAPPTAPAPPSKPAAPAPFSRFTVSPTPASRFSITHVSDPDAGRVGGPAGGAGGICKEA
ncbi:serine/threonine-protein kinase LMTK1 isoform X2 [Artibeus jamaicensis]|uniref:serine/threonine-protein kinase LMTK1 isoform X2 n=1 Tax=Artibeus jamaicensis TaxID=9417 RepID=UPI00235B090E|nr:serine/threonine-protein kinase LMTK1 isoform X2 [Artibeus jamaicensis]